MRVDRAGLAPLSDAVRTSVWITLVAGSSLLFSLSLACATPFAALATIAGTTMSRRHALLLVAAAWLANQTVGYLILGYPRTWDSFTWGAAIGIAAALATLVTREFAGRFGRTLALATGFVVAFIVYESALFAATAVLPSGAEAFSPSVVGEIFAINVLALAGLIAMHWAAVRARLVVPTQPGAQASSHA